jgi:hypothetical protein
MNWTRINKRPIELNERIEIYNLFSDEEGYQQNLSRYKPILSLSMYAEVLIYESYSILIIQY